MARLIRRIRSWLAGRLDTLASMARGRGPVRWCLIYGPERSGTSLMLRVVGTISGRMVGDWGLGTLLQLTPDYDYITFDRQRALRDISRNILDNALAGGGSFFDIAYKQAGLRVVEYRQLVKMWGQPQMIIFCLRDPAGYIASARTKFASASLAHLQDSYVRALEQYDEIGGRIFEYSSEVTQNDYVAFLKPHVNEDQLEAITYRGIPEPSKVTDDMWSAYHAFRGSHVGRVHPLRLQGTTVTPESSSGQAT